MVAEEEIHDVAKAAKEIGEGFSRIESVDDYVEACEALRDLAADKDEIETGRKSEKAPHADQAKAVDERFKPATTALKMADEKIRAAVIQFRGKCAARVGDLIAQVADAVSKGDQALAEELQRNAEALDVPPVEGIAFREEWSGTVVDMDAIPRQYLVPDLKALDAATKAANGAPAIPGWQPRRVVSLVVKKSSGD